MGDNNNDAFIVTTIYNIVKGVRDNLTLPTHATIEKTLYYSLGLLACSVFSSVLKFYTFISWQGCLLCVALICILLWIERSENDALLKMYRTAKVSATKVAHRAKSASSGVNSGRTNDVTGKRAKNTKGKRPGRGKVPKRPNGVNRNNKRNKRPSKHTR